MSLLNKRFPPALLAFFFFGYKLRSLSRGQYGQGKSRVFNSYGLHVGGLLSFYS